MWTYEIVVFEYGFRKHYFAPTKEKALELYTKYSKERPGNVKIFRRKEQKED